VVSPAEVVAFLGRQLLLWAAHRLHPSGAPHIWIGTRLVWPRLPGI